MSLTASQIESFSDGGTSVAQLVKGATLDLSSGLDLGDVSSSPVLGSMLGVEAALKK